MPEGVSTLLRGLTAGDSTVLFSKGCSESSFSQSVKWRRGLGNCAGWAQVSTGLQVFWNFATSAARGRACVPSGCRA